MSYNPNIKMAKNRFAKPLVCDRCGKPFDRSKTRIEFEDGHQEYVHGVMMFCSHKFTARKMSLCDECIKSFILWSAHGGADENILVHDRRKFNSLEYVESAQDAFLKNDGYGNSGNRTDEIKEDVNDDHGMSQEDFEAKMTETYAGRMHTIPEVYTSNATFGYIEKREEDKTNADRT